MTFSSELSLFACSCHIKVALTLILLAGHGHAWTKSLGCLELIRPSVSRIISKISVYVIMSLNVRSGDYWCIQIEMFVVICCVLMRLVGIAGCLRRWWLALQWNLSLFLKRCILEGMLSGLRTGWRFSGCALGDDWWVSVVRCSA